MKRATFNRVIKRKVFAKTQDKELPQFAFCYYCSEPLEPFDDWEIDHIVPKSRGGSDDLENLAPACAACNRKKRDRTVDEWRADIETILQNAIGHACDLLTTSHFSEDGKELAEALSAAFDLAANFRHLFAFERVVPEPAATEPTPAEEAPGEPPLRVVK